MLAIIVFVDWLRSSSRIVGDLSLDARVWMAINEKITDYKEQEDSKNEDLGWGSYLVQRRLVKRLVTFHNRYSAALFAVGPH